MPTSTVKKMKGGVLSCIVSASGDDHWITRQDLSAARRRHDARNVVHSKDRITVDGRRTTPNEERCDHYMMSEFMTYLATPTVVPMPTDVVGCTAFAHTSGLTPMATLDASCAFHVPHLNFETDTFLTQVMKQECGDGINSGMFAPFAASRVKKALRIIPNVKVTTQYGIARDYYVEMCILTGMGIMVARGFLYLKRAELDAVEKTLTGSVTFTNAHINWNTWGFDAQRCWSNPWTSIQDGHPFR
tara:strand:+ start:250 stop:984 length:735 start_codon:yes stop_codon:yes gene_type:complete